MRHPPLPRRDTRFVQRRCEAALSVALFSSSPPLGSQRKHPSDPHGAYNLSRFDSFYHSFFFSLSRLSRLPYQRGVCLCVFRLPIGQFRFSPPPPLSPPISQTCVCVKWQNMDQVTEKGGRLGHLSGPGEGILKQKAAPGFSEAEGEQGSASAGPSPHRKLSPSLTCCRPMTCGHIPTRAHRFSTVS